MKLEYTLLLLSLVSRVLGSRKAAGWEAVMYYYMYLIDYEAHDETNRRIGKGCKGQNGGRCNFAQFVDFYQPQNQPITVNGQIRYVGPFNPASVPNTLNLDEPDIRAASDIVNWPGYPGSTSKYSGAYEDNKLLTPNQPRTGFSYEKMLMELGDIVQDSRSVNSPHLAVFLDRVRQCLDQIVLGRQEEQEVNRMRDFEEKVLQQYNNGLPANEKLTVRAFSYTDPNTKETYNRFDSQKMAQDIMSHPTLDARAKTSIQTKITEFATNYENKRSLAKESNGPKHFRVISTVQAVASKLKGPPPTC